MKIILYTYDIMKIGGIETSFYNLARYLKAKGHDVAVRATKIDPLQLERFEGIDIGFEKVETCDVLFIGSVWRAPQKITSKIRVQQCHADWSDDFWNGGGGARQMIARADKSVDEYLCVSQSSADWVKKLTSKRVGVMYNLAPERTELEKVKHKGLVFSAFTRMSAEKGLKNYQAFRNRISELNIKAEFRVYTNGDAPDGWSLREPVKDIKTELADVDFVCSLADTESFGYTIAEANSAGVPCVIKRCNSTQEFFNDKNNLILDDCTNFTKKDLRRKISSYDLYDKTAKNIDENLERLEKLTRQRCIIRVKRRFRDLTVNRTRNLGETLGVTNKRAKELIKLDLAEKT